MDQEKLLARIIGQSGTPDLMAALCERISPTDLQSLMLEVYRRRADAITPGSLLADFENNRFTRLSKNDPRQQLRFDDLAFSLLPEDCQAVELSPVCPLGTSSVPATCHQNKVITTSRNSEVVADATNVLALECALRRREALRQGHLHRLVKLAASHRHVRAQAFDNPNFTAHFRLFVMVSGGRARGNYELETRTLGEQLDFWLQLMRRAKDLNYHFTDIRVRLTDLTPGEALTSRLRTEVLEPLSARFTEVAISLFPERKRGRGYYENACFRINARTPSGEDIELGDGGFTNWTQQLLSNRKERLLVGGLGSEVAMLFRAP